MSETSGYVLHDASAAGNNGIIANQPYISGNITSEPNYTFTYGYFESRLQAAPGQGMGTAFWMYATSGTNEIDTVQYYASDTPGWSFTEQDYYSSNYPGGQFIYNYTTAPGTGFHRYGVQWTPSGVTFYVDGAETGSFADTSLTTPMELILGTGANGPAWSSNYQPSPSEFPATAEFSGVWAYNPSGTCASTSPTPEPTPTGTTALPSGNVCVNGTNYVPETPPTGNFSTLSQHSAGNPSGTWTTSFPYGFRTNGGRYNATFYVDNSASGFNIWPFATGGSGLTITQSVAPNEISGFQASSLAQGDSASLNTLNSTATGGVSYLESGYTPASGSFSIACYISLSPQTVSSVFLLGTGPVPYGANGYPVNTGFDLQYNSYWGLQTDVGHGTGTSSIYGAGGTPIEIKFNTPMAFALTYNDSTKVATLYAGYAGGPVQSGSVTLSSAYVASGHPVYFNAGQWTGAYAGAQFGPCAEWDGTALTQAEINNLMALVAP